MRWLILQSGGEHDGMSDNWTPNNYMRECLSLQYALLGLQQDTDVWGPRHPNFKETPRFEDYDVVLLVENYAGKWLPDFSEIRKPLKMQWAIDLHCSNSCCTMFMGNMDVVLHSTRHLIPRFQEVFPHQTHVWFPNAADPRFFYPHAFTRCHEVVFVGSVLNREAWLQKMEREVGARRFFATGMDMVSLISQAKIHLNRDLNRDVNYRNFETLGLGTCLVTRLVPEMLDLGFVSGSNCFLWKTDEDCVTGVKELLASGDWKRIGDAGAELAKQHTYLERAKQLVSLAKER